MDKVVLAKKFMFGMGVVLIVSQIRHVVGWWNGLPRIWNLRWKQSITDGYFWKRDSESSSLRTRTIKYHLGHSADRLCQK